MEVAKVNGKTITDKDMVQALGGVNETQRKDVLDDANSRRQLLNSLIEQELLIKKRERKARSRRRIQSGTRSLP